VRPACCDSSHGRSGHDHDNQPRRTGITACSEALGAFIAALYVRHHPLSSLPSGHPVVMGAESRRVSQCAWDTLPVRANA
jgi:hypothetical protein